MNFMKGEEREKSYKLYKIASERLVKYMKGDFPLIQLTPYTYPRICQSSSRGESGRYNYQNISDFDKGDIKLCR